MSRVQDWDKNWFSERRKPTKGMICRWLANDVKLLILNMPTRGVDVGARAEIYRALEDLADQGVAVLAVSPEMQEVLALADVVYVMHEG